MRDHSHMPVLGGSRITAPAGLYPRALARTLVRGLEAQFEKDFKPCEVLVAGVHEDDGDQVVAVRGEIEDNEASDEEFAVSPDEKKLVIPGSVKATIRPLHENTGHRSNTRLARALTLAGAPLEAIVAAKRHQCAVCQERKPPKVRRPASLPTPKDLGDQVHLDLLEIEDAREKKYFVAHCTDYATRFQAAEILADKSTKEVIRFMATRWLPTFGAPRVLVCDQGREFISWEMEEWTSSISTLLHHIAVQAPWQNGVAEKSGGILKTLMSAIVRSKSVVTKEEMDLALAEAVAAYNGDVDGESGTSPYQAALGRQPRMIGDVLGGVQQRLAEHGLIESKPSLARQLAMREVAKVAMTRLHFSRGMRKAELARSRDATFESLPEPGSICYFYRPLRFNTKTSVSRKRLTLKRWHGPALLVALEGNSSAFLSYKGQLTKCALEHVRKASSMEQIAAGTWREAIEEAVEAARLDVPLPGAGEVHLLPEEDGVTEADDELRNPATPAFLPSSSAGIPIEEGAPLRGEDLPPVGAREFLPMIVPATPQIPSQVGSTVPSRRTSDFAQASPFPEADQRMRERKTSAPLLGASIERAQRLDQSREESGGQKRPAEQDPDSLRKEGEEVDRGPDSEQLQVSRVNPADHEVHVLSKEQILERLAEPNVHPLRQAQLGACLDRMDPLESEVKDHGSWGGRWDLPSRSEWQVHQRLGVPWPTGAPSTQEVNAVQAARKEFHWRSMTSDEKIAFAEAAKQAWAVWEENDAIEILTPEESDEVRKRLKACKEDSRILTPRYVFTDRHESLRTAQNPLPLKARARVIVPGYKDVFSFALRKDAPTGSRISQHLLFIYTAHNSKRHPEPKDCWRLMSADVKSAFLKGDAYMEGTRELFLENVKGDDPKLPFGNQLAKIRKGVFGLADAPRQWYLKLNQSFLEAGWERSVIDYACWMLWSEDRKQLEGMVISHVDDLLLGGNSKAQESLMTIGAKLGFGTVEFDDFVFCGKRIRMLPSGEIELSMVEYHSNLKPVAVTTSRRAMPQAELSDSERRQLRAILGSLQWLVAQLRFDQAYALSTLQGEKPCVATLTKANLLVKEFKRRSDFKLVFRDLPLEKAGILVISDASLGNTTKSGGVEGQEKLYSQSSYFILVCDENLLQGREGWFNVLDARSHRLPRVCRSTYSSETLGLEEAMDAGVFCRGCFSVLAGLPMERRDAHKVMEVIPMTAITDAKDTFDRGNSDTNTYGAQKSLAFSVAWIRATLGGANTSLKWTATANMWVDAGTKDMPLDHLHRILDCGRWSYVYNANYVKQPKKKKTTVVAVNGMLPGVPLAGKTPIFPFLLNVSRSPGWHQRSGLVVHVASNAKSFRVPDARFSVWRFPLRSTYGRFDLGDGRSEWRELESRQDLTVLGKKQELLGQEAGCLVSVFESRIKKEGECTEDAVFD